MTGCPTPLTQLYPSDSKLWLNVKSEYALRYIIFNGKLNSYWYIALVHGNIEKIRIFDFFE